MEALELIGRAPEQAAIRAALARARAGSGGLLLVAGEAGIGKTRLVDATLHAAGVRALRGPSRDTRAATPYAPLAIVLRAHLADAPGALDGDPLRAHLALLLPELGLSLPEHSTAALLHEALRAALVGVARAAPVVVLEDLHWADHATLEFLPPLADALTSVPLLVLGTYRREDLPRAHPLRRTRLELQRGGHLQELTVSALPGPDTAALAARSLGAPLGPALAELVHARSEGVPLFVQEFLWALQAGGCLEVSHAGQLHLRAGAEPAAPLTLRDAVLLNLDRLSAGARAAAEVAAVLGQSFEAEQLLALIGEDAVFDTLTDAGLLVEARGQVTFRHALIRDAIHAGIPWARRRRLHRQVAALLDARGAPPAALAEHWLAGQEPERARGALLAAVRTSCRLHAYRDAAEAAGRALELWPDGTDEPERLAVLDQLGRCAQACGLLPEAARAWREAAQAHREAGDAASSAEAQRRLAGALELQGLWEQALEARRGAAEAFDAAGRPAAAAEERLAVGSALRATSRNTAALDALRVALDGARRAGRRDLEARILGQTGNALVRAGQIEAGLSTGRAGLTLALQVDHTGATVEALHRIADSLEHAGDYTAARSAYADAIGVCADAGQPDFACRACLAVPLYQNGDWNAVASECRRVLESPAAPAVPRAVVGAMLGTVLAHRGQRARARPLLHDALATSRQLGLVPVQLRALWGLALLDELDDPHAAHAWADALSGVWEGAEDHYHVLFPMRWAATFHAERGAQPEVARAVRTLSRAADLNGGPVAYSALAHALGELAWLDGQLPRASAQFEVAVALLRDTRTPFEEASSRLRAGQALAAQQRPEEAADHLTWAHRTARTLNAPVLADRAARALAAIGRAPAGRGARPPNGIGLTPRQLEVLRLVAQGRTDKAIAQDLQLSPRTVEMHVGHILASLDSHSRAEAVGKAAELGLLMRPT